MLFENAAERRRIEQPFCFSKTVAMYWLFLGCYSPSLSGQRDLRRQLCAAFGAAALQNKASGFRRHAGAETMGPCTLDLAGLKCAFHCWYLGHKPAENGPYFRKAGKGTQKVR